MVKKANIGILHDRARLNDGSVEEFRSAISHTKESKSPFQMASYNINPLEVLALFKRMSDEVCYASITLARQENKYVILSVRLLNVYSCNFQIDLQDCEVLFLRDRPEKLLIEKVAVPPIAVRPSVIMDGSQRSLCTDILGCSFLFS